MRVYLLVSSVNPNIPSFVDEVLRSSPHDVIAVGRVALANHQSKLKWLGKQIEFWGAWGAVIFGLTVLKQKIRGAVFGNLTTKSIDLVNLCGYFNVPTEAVSDVNGPAFVESIRARNIDVLISFQPSIFRAPLLSAPRLCCLNVHTGILPGYRGLRPVFRMMSEGVEELGVTVHSMTEQIDVGQIVHTARWPNSPGSTLIENNKIAYGVAAQAVVVALSKLEDEGLATAAQIPPASRYFRNPTRDEVKDAQRRGMRLY